MEISSNTSSPHVPASVLYRPILLTSMAFTFLIFGLPIYSKELGASALEIGGLYTIITATILLGRPLVGWAIDHYGRKPFLLIAFAGYGVAMVAFAFSKSLPGLYMARFAQGIASSLLWITVYTIVADIATIEQRGQMAGGVNQSSAQGGMIGVVGGFVVMTLVDLGKLPVSGWTVIFIIYSILAFYGGWLAWKNVPETRPVRTVVTSSRVVSPTLVKLMAVVFITNLASALISPIYLVFLQDKFTTNISTLAWAFFPAGIVYSLLPARLGKLSDRHGRAPMMAVGLVGAGILSLFLPKLSSLVWLVILYTLTAVGWSMADPAETAMVADLTGRETRGRGYGLYELAVNLGASIGPLLGGWVYDSLGKNIPFYVNGIVLIIGAAWILIFFGWRR